MDTTAIGAQDIRGIAQSLGMVMEHARGDVIFREGDQPRCMYVVLDGQVEVRRHDRIIEVVGPGQALGIVSLLDGKLRTVTAEACSNCKLAVVSLKQFRFAVEEVPHFGWYVMGELAHRLRMTNAVL